MYVCVQVRDVREEKRGGGSHFFQSEKLLFKSIFNRDATGFIAGLVPMGSQTGQSGEKGITCGTGMHFELGGCDAGAGGAETSLGEEGC